MPRVAPAREGAAGGLQKPTTEPPATLGHVIGQWIDQHGTKYYVKPDGGVPPTTCTVACTKITGKASTLRAMVRLIEGSGDRRARVVWGHGMGEEYDLDMTKASRAWIRWNHSHGKAGRVFEWHRVEDCPSKPPSAPPGLPPGKPLKGRRSYTPMDMGGAPVATPAGAGKLAPWSREVLFAAPKPQPTGGCGDVAEATAEAEDRQVTRPASSSSDDDLGRSGDAACPETPEGPGACPQAEVQAQECEDQTCHVPLRVQAGQIMCPEANQEFICRICLDLCAEPAVLPCSHLFCKVCLRLLASWNGAPQVQCPACRAEFPREQLLEDDFKGNANELALIRRCIDVIPVCCVFAHPSELPDTADDPISPEHMARMLGLSCRWVGHAGAFPGHIEECCPVAQCARQLVRVRSGQGPRGGCDPDCLCVLQRDAEVATADSRVPVPSGTPCLIQNGRGEAGSGSLEVLVTTLWPEDSLQPLQGWAPAAAFVPTNEQPLRTRSASDVAQGNTGYLALDAGEDVFAHHFEWHEGTKTAWFFGHSAAAPDLWGWFASGLIQWHLGPMPEIARKP